MTTALERTRGDSTSKNRGHTFVSFGTYQPKRMTKIFVVFQHFLVLQGNFERPENLSAYLPMNFDSKLLRE